jgi:hypothetical protein
MSNYEAFEDPRTPYQILFQDHASNPNIDPYAFLVSLGESEVLARFGAGLFFRSLDEDRRRVEAAKVPYRSIRDIPAASTNENEPIL